MCVCVCVKIQLCTANWENSSLPTSSSVALLAWHSCTIAIDSAGVLELAPKGSLIEFTQAMCWTRTQHTKRTDGRFKTFVITAMDITKIQTPHVTHSATVSFLFSLRHIIFTLASQHPDDTMRTQCKIGCDG